MKTLFAFLLICFNLVSFSQDSMNLHYKIYDTRSKQNISIEKIVQDMADADVLFFGEEHNDSAGHYLENKIFRALYAAYGKTLALSMEMFETDNQLVLDEYLHGRIDEKRLNSDARLWSNYRDYRPMIEFARENKIPVIAANPPRRYVSLVTRRGMKALDSLSEEAKFYLPPLPFDTLSGRYREKFMEIMKGAPESASRNIYYSQSLWDAGMSYSIHRFYKKNKGVKIFHCVGKFHVEEHLGTAAQLAMRNRKIKMLVISCFPDKSFDNPDWSKFEKLGDYVILTNDSLKRTY
jgi:uncharacterized iron-regulated protein